MRIYIVQTIKLPSTMYLKYNKQKSDITCLRDSSPSVYTHRHTHYNQNKQIKNSYSPPHTHTRTPAAGRTCDSHVELPVLQVQVGHRGVSVCLVASNGGVPPGHRPAGEEVAPAVPVERAGRTAARRRAAHAVTQLRGGAEIPAATALLLLRGTARDGTGGRDGTGRKSGGRERG